MRVSPRPLSDYPIWIRSLFAMQKRKYGQILQSAMLWARSPRLFGALSMLYGAIDRKNSPIDPALKSLVLVRVSQINHCVFCVDLNSKTLLDRGVDMKKLDALDDWRAQQVFTDLEQAVLDYTEAVTRTDGEITDTMIERLRAHFDDDGLVELTGLIAFQNMSTKFNNAMNVEPQGFCKLPAEGKRNDKLPT